ncbi:dihydroorotate dehydrogenase-like protein [Geoalkalibacter halelectricus]|uniref:dihydroorotate dehydrogenase-like protein n=1 Tax=Geoalkalibacter halelectricus TaxID=2847045 RepID=UPI003D1DA9C4
MPDLSTNYMGLKLSNPLIVASSSLTGSVEGVKRCAAAGAAAVVLKSLFEEQIEAETAALSGYADYAGHCEAGEYLQNFGAELGPREYLKLVEDAKRAVQVPVIASLNCYTDKSWVDYARKLEAAGADAIELNIALLPVGTRQPCSAVEETCLRIVHDVKSLVRIPVAVKIGPYFSSLAHFARKLCNDVMEGPEFSVGWCGPGATTKTTRWRGADGLVLFNRFYQFDIDIERLTTTAGNPYSTPAEMHTALRWISLLAGRVDAHLAATTGIHDGSDAVKQLLAGAHVLQLCSTLYENGLGRIEEILAQIGAWMQAQGFEKLDEFRGHLSQARSKQPKEYERLQYIKLFVGIE